MITLVEADNRPERAVRGPSQQRRGAAPTGAWKVLVWRRRWRARHSRHVVDAFAMTTTVRVYEASKVVDSLVDH